MSFEFNPMNTNPNEISHIKPEQVAAAEELLKNSTLSLEGESSSEKTVEHFGGELNTHLMIEKKSQGAQMRINPFDAAGRHVVGNEEAAKAEAMLKKLGSDASGLTLQ